MEDLLSKIQRAATAFKRRVNDGGDWRSLETLNAIDHYFDTHLSKNLDNPDHEIDAKTEDDLITIGAFVGEVLIANMIGAYWEVDSEYPDDIVKAIVNDSTGSVMWPFQKTLKRYYNGPEDSLYGYGLFTIDHYKEACKKNKQTKKQLAKEEKAANRKWWHFW